MPKIVLESIKANRATPNLEVNLVVDIDGASLGVEVEVEVDVEVDVELEVLCESVPVAVAVG